MLTKNGICYDLEHSPYVVQTRDIDFFFSSMFYKQKFLEEYLENRNKISTSISNRFSLNVTFTNLADLVLYEKIEKRGFYIKFRGEIYICKNSLKLHGDNLRDKN